jgi:Toprim-like/Protein of unknown function (DUF3991)
MSDAELETFKTAIDLRAYAAAQGYVWDKRESWRGSTVMRDPAGDKIIIKRDSDGHYVFFSVHRDGASGSIIDFIQKRRGGSLGAVRKELRAWLGLDTRPDPGQRSHVPAFSALPRTGKDRIRVETELARMPAAKRHPYLEQERKLPAALFDQPRFAGCIRIDGRGNAVFPHFDGQGICGYEIKNRGYTGFARGGSKGLWSSHTEPDDTRLVFCESAIDALSHAVLFPDEHTRYASIGGQVNPTQPELIRAAAAGITSGAGIVAAMDADTDGRKLAEVVRQSVSLTGRGDLHFTIEEPAGVKDWNDQLRASGHLNSPR